MGIFKNLKQSNFCGYLIISCLGSASYLKSLFGDFVFDDTEVILNNEDILPKTPLTNIFAHDYWGTSMKHNLSHKSYRPLTILTFRLNYIVFGGLKPWNFHLVNVILHVLVSILSWSVFVKILGKERKRTGFCAALLFSVHPVHSEAVCGIVGRADLLAALFFFLSFLAFTKVITGKFNRLVWISITVFLAAASMFCKEQGITIIGILSVYNIVITYRININKSIKSWNHLFEKKKKLLPAKNYFLFSQCTLIISAVILLMFRYYLMDFQSPPFQIVDNPASFEKQWLTRVLSYNYIYFLNVWLFLCPEWLCFDWSMGCIPIVKYADKRIFFVILFWIVITWIIWKGLSTNCARRQRDILMAFSLMVIPFLPASNMFFRVGFVLAERVLYIPSAGFCLLIVCGIEILIKAFPFSKNEINLAFYFLILIFLIRAYVRSSDWLSEHALFNSGLKVCPLNAKVHYNVAIAALSSGNVEKSVAEYKEAIRLFPDYYQALNNLANILKNEGSLDEAEKLLRRALAINQKFPAAWMNLGVVLAQKKKFREAENSYYEALKYRKNYPDCYYNLGKLYLEENKLKEAEKAWMIAIKLKPLFTVAWNNLIILTSQIGDYRQAVTLAEDALKILGDEPSIHFNMANALGKMGELYSSEQHFLKSIQLKPGDPQYHLNLGVLYHRWKKYSKAEECYKKALQLNPDFKVAKENYDLLKKIFVKEKKL